MILRKAVTLLVVFSLLATAAVFLAGCTTTVPGGGTQTVSPTTTGSGVVTPVPTTAPPTLGGQKTRVLLATTTSLYDTGLLDYLKPKFEGQYNAELLITSQGTGKALEIASRGDANVLAVHSPTQEQAYMASGKGLNRRCFAYNYFIIVGPEEDPVGIRGMEPVAAFTKIRELGINNTPGVMFVSRGDNSGTHSKEKDIWKAAGFNYSADIQKSGAWYIEAGRGMGETLQLTSEKQAYTLSDEGTYLTYKGNMDLMPLIDQGEILLNIYSVIAVYNEKFTQDEIEMANNFVDFMIAPATQDAIGIYGVDTYGKPLFTPMKGACSQFDCVCTSPATEMTPVPA
jgi:tungstate transport system substrate-binding protein